MFEIQVNATSANIKLGKGNPFYFEQSGGTPSHAARNLIFYMEAELERFEMVGESYLSKEAQEKMQELKKFIRKPE